MSKDPVKRKPGRPDEGRVKLTCYVLPRTMARITQLMGKAKNTKGKVVDAALSDQPDKRPTAGS